MAILNLPNGGRIQLPDNMSAREAISMLREQGMDPVLYDTNQGRPLAPDEKLGNRTLEALDQSQVGGYLDEFQKKGAIH